MASQGWKTPLIVLVSVAVGLLLADGTILSRADAQSEGRTSGVICVMGEAVNQNAPIVLIDIPEQTILVYEYSYQNNESELTATRTYRFDRLLREFRNDGVSVDEVARQVTAGRR